MENTNKRSWFSYCPFAYSGNNTSEIEKPSSDEVNTSVIYVKPVGGKSDD